MKKYHWIILSGMTLIAIIVGFLIGHKTGIKIGREHEYKRINDDLWTRALSIEAKDFEDSKLVFVRHIMRYGDDYKNKVRIKNDLSEYGLVVNKLFDNGSSHMSSMFHDSIYLIKNTTNIPITVNNSFFTNLPVGYNVEWRPYQEQIILKPSEQAAPSNH